MITDRTRTVLVIEDNWLNREMLCSILEPYYMVIPAQDGQEGLELLLANKSKISLILLDIEMPVMDGYQFLENIRGMEEFANLPIIVTTSSNSTADEIKCLDKGAADFVSKPYNNDVVLKRVESKIRLREASAIISKAENDSLTGFYNEEFFYIYAERLLQQEEGEFDVFSTDVRAFKMFTERYGSITGNELVLCIRDVIAKAFDREEKVVFGKAGNDRFLVLCPGRDKGFYRELSSKISAAIRKANGSRRDDGLLQERRPRYAGRVHLRKRGHGHKHHQRPVRRQHRGVRRQHEKEGHTAADDSGQDRGRHAGESVPGVLPDEVQLRAGKDRRRRGSRPVER